MGSVRLWVARLMFCGSLVMFASSVAVAGDVGVKAAADSTASIVVYRDRDPAAMGYQARPGQKNKLRNAVRRTLQKDPQNVAALSQRAYWHAESGEIEAAQRDYEAAIAASADNPANRARVLWSRGWSHYGQGDVPGALADWSQAERLHGGHPFWVPYTYAVAYWTLGDRDRALAWYDVAVASRSAWGDEGGMKDLTRHWNDREKEQLLALFAAWQDSRSEATASAH